MRTLVTGGAGFIGSHVVDALLGAGHQVAVVDNLATGSRSNLDSRAEFFEADVRDQPEIDRVFQLTRPAAVLHLAAQTLVAGAVSDPHRDAHINVLGTLSVLRAAAGAASRKVIFASSGGTVYGDARVQPVAETHPLNPISPYGVSKVAGEHYVRVLCSQAGLAYTILRYGNVYGPRDIPASRHVITAFLHAIVNGERPVIEWDGEQAKDYVFVRDVAAAHLRALDAGDGEAFNLGSGGAVSVNEIFRQVCAAAGVVATALHRPGRTGDVRRFILDCTKAREQLGWHAATPFTAGLQETVGYYQRPGAPRRDRDAAISLH